MADDFGREAMAFEGELAYRLTLMSVTHPYQPRLCDNAQSLNPAVGISSDLN
jgi:hypothetical protein